MDQKTEDAVIELITAREHAQALGLLQRELAANPEDYFSNYHVGVCLRFLGKIDEAIPYLRTSIRLKPNSSSAHLSLGIAYQLMGQFQPAVMELQKAIELNNELVEAYNSLGLTYRKMDQPRMALESYEKGLDRLWQLVHRKVHDAPSKCYRMEPDGTRTVLPFVLSETQRLLKSDVLYSVLCNNAGTCLQLIGDIEQARERFQEAIDCTPEGLDYPDPVANLRSLEH